MQQKPSITFAGPIWNQFMEKALSSKIEPGSFTLLPEEEENSDN